MRSYTKIFFAVLVFLNFLVPVNAHTKRSKYFIALKKNEGEVLNDLNNYTPFLAPKGHFYADPILFKHEGKNYVFFEDFDYKKGIISYVTVDKNLKYSQPKKALELPIHLSFPHVFIDEGEFYMTPETYDYQSVSLYKAEEFPDIWKQERVLIQGEHFADPILFKHNGFYWLFVAVREDKLRIFYAKNLQEEFLPHPINQLEILGRNAGKIFHKDGKLIRPTMDCRKGYGRSMILKEILHLDTTDFVEREIAYIEPNWAPELDGTHSYCENEDLVVYDGRRTIYPTEDRKYSCGLVEGKLTGQLGNQMFVIAAATSHAIDQGAVAVFPDLLSDKTNGIPVNFENVFFHLNTTKARLKNKYTEPFYHYAPIPEKSNIALSGYFQSEKYFKHNKEKIIQLFAAPKKIREYLQIKYKDILDYPNTVSLHFRSYKDHDPDQKTFIQYDRAYFEKAMSIFPADSIFIIFSNDMNACKKELSSLNRQMIFIENEPYYHDLYLMSMCKHNILCNSSFSWWAAYLNPNPNKKVITPPRWYTDSSGLDDKDMIPEEWIKLEL